MLPKRKTALKSLFFCKNLVFEAKPPKTGLASGWWNQKALIGHVAVTEVQNMFFAGKHEGDVSKATIFLQAFGGECSLFYTLLLGGHCLGTTGQLWIYTCNMWHVVNNKQFTHVVKKTPPPQQKHWNQHCSAGIWVLGSVGRKLLVTCVCFYFYCCFLFGLFASLNGVVLFGYCFPWL